MHPSRLAVAIILIVAIPPDARAQAADSARGPRVDLSVEQVVSGGYWQVGKAAGAYRVIVVREGWEEIRRRAVVEWIEEGEAHQPDSLRRSVALNERAAVYALSDPVIIRRGAHWIVRVKAASRPLSPYNQIVEFELGTPGSVTLLRHP